MSKKNNAKSSFPVPISVQNIICYKYTEVRENTEHYARLENLKKELDIDLDKKKLEVSHKLDKIEKLGDLEWDDDCDYCMSNPFTLDAIETKKKLEDDKKVVKDYLLRIDTISEKIDNLYANFL